MTDHFTFPNCLFIFSSFLFGKVLKVFADYFREGYISQSVKKLFIGLQSTCEVIYTIRTI